MTKELARELFKYVGVIALVLVLFFMNNNNNKNTPDMDSCYIENISSDPPTLDPHMADDNVSWRVIVDLFEGLVGYNQKNEIELCGAEKYEVSDDGLTYTFHLRKDAKWSNGDPVTAEDYIFSLQRAITPTTLAKFYTQMLDIVNAPEISQGNLSATSLGVEKKDNYTLIIRLKNKNQEFIHYLTLPTFFPVHKATIEKNGSSWATNVETIISNGAYKAINWIHNGHIDLTKNEHYWNKDKVKIEQVNFLMINGVTDDLNKFSTKGEHMTYYNLPVETVDWYKKKFGDEFVSYKHLGQERIIFNLKNKKFQDIRVRKALSMAFDRDNIVNNVFKSGTTSYCAILETISNGAFLNELDNIKEFAWVEKSFKERVEEAKELLAEAGYSKEHPLEIELAFPTGGNHKAVAEAIQITWNDAFKGSVVCSLLFQDWSIFLQNQAEGKYEISRAAWGADYNLPTSFTQLYTTGSSFNFIGYSNPEVDRLYAESLKQKSPEKYIEKQKEINEIIMRDYVAIPYASKEYRRLVSKKLKGVDFSKNVLDRFSTKYFELEKIETPNKEN